MQYRKVVSMAAIALISVVMAIGLCSCGGSGSSSTNSEKQSVLENESVTIDAVYVNDEYVNTEHPSLRQVWVFATLHPTSGTLETSSYSGTLMVADEKYSATYDSSKYGIWFPSYHYSNVIKKVLKGESFKLACTFEVSESDLNESAEITFENLGKANCDNITVLGKDVKHATNTEEIAKVIDPEGYAKAVESREPADQATADAVVNALNNMDYYASYGKISWKCSFGNRVYSLTSYGITTTGVYEVLNGYLLFTNNDNGAKSYIPWEWKSDGDINIDLPSGLLGENG